MFPPDQKLTSQNLSHIPNLVFPLFTTVASIRILLQNLGTFSDGCGPWRGGMDWRIWTGVGLIHWVVGTPAYVVVKYALLLRARYNISE